MRGTIGRPGDEAGGLGPGRVHDQVGLEPPAAAAAHAARLDRLDAQPRPDLGAAAPGALEQDARGRGRVEDAVARHPQRAREARPQLRLGLAQRRRVEHLGRLAPRLVEGGLPPDVLHLLLVRGDPQRPAGVVLDLRRAGTPRARPRAAARRT